MLVSQLGFIPGNGICVASRVSNLQSKFPFLYRLLLRAATSGSGAEDGKSNGGCMKDGAQDRLCSLPDSPIVLKLYPLAHRDVYSGGKADGRKFKARKRSSSHFSSTEGTGDNAQSKGPEIRHDNKKAVSVIETASANQIQTSAPQKKRKYDKDECTKPPKPAPQTTTIEPFPTMYWLTHPHLRGLISQLEISSTHNVKLLEERLKSRPAYLKSMERAHISYGTNRWKLLTDRDVTDIVSKRHWEGALGLERGVAGIRKHNTIKCLHAHAAHFLAQDSSSIGCGAMETGGEGQNIVGKWVVEALEEMLVSGDWKDLYKVQDT